MNYIQIHNSPDPTLHKQIHQILKDYFRILNKKQCIPLKITL